MSFRRRDPDEVAGQELAELAALADGSLAADRRTALEARVSATPELADRLAEQEQAIALARSAAAETAAPASLRASIEAQRRARSRRSPRGVVAIGFGAAATAAVALAIGLGIFGTDAGGERFTAALAPTGLLPTARGEATLTKTSSGWRIDLDASGLPRLEGGQFYQAWLRDPAGVLVPIGTFNEGRGVTLWAGVSPEDFPLLTITRERADADQASSGEKVLVGTVDTGG